MFDDDNNPHHEMSIEESLEIQSNFEDHFVYEKVT